MEQYIATSQITDYIFQSIVERKAAAQLIAVDNFSSFSLHLYIRAHNISLLLYLEMLQYKCDVAAVLPMGL